MHYANPRHARRCRNVMRGKNLRSQTLAALYLFTADGKLWNRWRLALSGQDIDWDARKPIDPGWNGIALEKAAMTIAGKSMEQITLRDLTDCCNYPKELMRLIVTALVIARAEPREIQDIIIMKKRRRFILC